MAFKKHAKASLYECREELAAAVDFLQSLHDAEQFPEEDLSAMGRPSALLVPEVDTQGQQALLRMLMFSELEKLQARASSSL